MEDLKRKRRAVDEALETTRQELKKERQKETDAKRSRVRADKLMASLLRIALIIYVLASYKTEPAVKFLVAAGRKRRWPERSEEELESTVVDCFLKVDEHELAALVDEASPSDEAALREAVAYVEQWRLVEWTRALNAQQGVAPSTSAVLQRLEVRRLRVLERVRPVSRGTDAEGKSRMWALRWRRRWASMPKSESGTTFRRAT